MDTEVPKPGHWPVDPQEDEEIQEERIWIDGCFDFFHHGHAGVMLQARKLGQELYVGLHSDEDILEHKGPTVMNLEERMAASEACRWTTRTVPRAPYVTSLPWISHYGCRYVVHGDDITSDSSGQDSYRYVKQAGRMKIVKRTPGISTTDLVGRMLLLTKSHFVRNLDQVLFEANSQELGKDEQGRNTDVRTRLHDYAADETGKNPGAAIWICRPSDAKTDGKPSSDIRAEKYLSGVGPFPDQRRIYVDGGFDLFSSGHIEFLRQVQQIEATKAEKEGWNRPEAIERRKAANNGQDYPRAYVIVGIHNDEEINHYKGLNYPIMNLFERALCVLQCQYISAILLAAPFFPTTTFLRALPHGGIPTAVYHGNTSFIDLGGPDPYADAKSLGIFEQVPKHRFQEVNASHVVKRIMDSRELYIERQRKKGIKAEIEDAVKRREVEEGYTS